MLKTAHQPAKHSSKGRIALQPRKQPAQKRAQFTVDAILEAAAYLLESDGLQAFNTNAVAERAGVSIGSLYQYFPGKDALMATLVSHFESDLRKAIARSVAATKGKSLPAALSDVIDAQWEQHSRRSRLHRILELEERRLMPEHDVDGNVAYIVTLFCKLLRRYRSEIARPNLRAAAVDCLVIIRAFTDASVEGGHDLGSLQPSKPRLLCAVLGYLSYRKPTTTPHALKATAAGA